MFSYCEKLICLIAEELQGFDVYKEVISAIGGKSNPLSYMNDQV
jgi:hypothetical protein